MKNFSLFFGRFKKTPYLCTRKHTRASFSPQGNNNNPRKRTKDIHTFQSSFGWFVWLTLVSLSELALVNVCNGQPAVFLCYPAAGVAVTS